MGLRPDVQLANRPRDSSSPGDAEDDPTDELVPYCISSKKLESSFVMLADGGAQHSVELVWDGSYESSPSTPESELQEDVSSNAEGANHRSHSEEPPRKRRAISGAREEASGGKANVVPMAVVEATQSGRADVTLEMAAAQSARLDDVRRSLREVLERRTERDASESRLEARLMARSEREVLRFFAGPLLSDLGPVACDQVEGADVGRCSDRRVLWTPRRNDA